MITLPSKIEYCIGCLADAGYEACVVGGCVRDSLLGREVNDWDITTSALPDDTARVFADRDLILNGLKHGTVSVMIDGEPIEITTYRIDGSYTDGRHPDEVKFTRSLHEDLARRDFTINAMAYRDGEIIDEFGGRDDLKNGIIRCVGIPRDRFHEDGLRILRGMRFAASLGFTFDPTTARAALDCAAEGILDCISVERIYSELRKMICADHADYVLESFAPIMKKLFGADYACRSVEMLPHDFSLRWTVLYGNNALDALSGLKPDRKTVNECRTLTEMSAEYESLDHASLRMLLGELGYDGCTRLLHYRGRAELISELDMIVSRGECCSLRQLAIDGKVLTALSICHGSRIGETLDCLLHEVIYGRVPNEREALTALAKKYNER